MLQSFSDLVVGLTRTWPRWLLLSVGLILIGLFFVGAVETMLTGDVRWTLLAIASAALLMTR